MSSLCLADGAFTATLFAQALHLAWTPADGTAREASYVVDRNRLVLIAERIAQSPATPKAPEPSVLANGWHHHWPQSAPRQRIVLERAALQADYVLCGQGWCRPLEHFLPRAQAPTVELYPCGAAPSDRRIR